MENKVLTGTVIWFEPGKGKGYGFIKQADGTDIFVHFSDIVSDGFKTLKKDDKVSYEIGFNRRGLPKAQSVVVLK